MNLQNVKIINYSPSHDGMVVDNQPDFVLKGTGNYELDIHGCWHEYEITKFKCKSEYRNSRFRNLKLGDKMWLVGHYPKD